tara:strand:- start:10056 stop:10913 length:858 start_codon:yes stop_codon:yes gene_type:complete
MQLIVKILDFLFASNVYVSLGVVSLTLLSLDIRQTEHPNLLWFVFFATLFVYNFIRLVNVHSIISLSESLRHQIIYRFRTFFWIVCIGSALIGFYFFVTISEYIFLPIIGLGFVSVIYGLPIYKNGSHLFRLRDVPGLKIFLIAFVWAYVTEGLPALISDEPLYFLALFERFLFIFAITIPFDIRDVNYDASHLATIPQYFGINTAKWMALLSILSCELILFYRFFFNNDLNLIGAISIYITYELSFILIYRCSLYSKERYFTIGVEGMSILMGALFFFSQRCIG